MSTPNCQLSNQGIRRLVLHDLISGSGVHLIKVTWFLQLIAYQVMLLPLDRGLKSFFFSPG